MKKIYVAVYIAAAFARLALSASTPDLTTIYTFSGVSPLGLSSGSNGALYGAASGSGTLDYCGLIFELQPPSSPGGAWTETVLDTFLGVPGPCGPVGAPMAAANGALYGLTFTGGAYNFGTLYELQPPAAPGGPWSETVLYSFANTGPYQGFPTALILGPSGQIYVTATYSVIELQPPALPGGAWTPVLLYSFTGGAAGSLPTSLIAGPGGRLYGATQYGGGIQGNGGTIFELRPPAAAGGAWTHKVLLSFDGKNGVLPNPVTLASDGSLYGSAHGDSTSGGPVYQLSPPSLPGEGWTQTILAGFGTYPGCGPDSPLIVRNGNVYGSSCTGVVFELQPPSAPGGPWTNVTLYTFTTELPTGSMVLTEGGTLYGVAYNGAPSGIVYRITTR